MFIKKFNSFLNESLQLDNGNILDEEDVNSIFHDFLEDLPELKNAKIEFKKHSAKNLSDQFQIDFVLNSSYLNDQIYDKENSFHSRFYGSFYIPHNPLFKTDILDEIDERMQDQFEYQLKDKTWYGGSNFIGIGFIFGKIEKNYKRDPKKEISSYKGPMPKGLQPFRTHTPKRRIVNESSEYEYSHEQIKELLTDFTDEHIDIQLTDQLGKKCIRLFYIFDIPRNCKIYEYEEKIGPNIDTMQEIVERLEDCGYRIDYKGFWNSYLILRHPKAAIFCDIYNKNPTTSDFKRKPIFVDDYYFRLLASRG